MLDYFDLTDDRFRNTHDRAATIWDVLLLFVDAARPTGMVRLLFHFAEFHFARLDWPERAADRLARALDVLWLEARHSRGYGPLSTRPDLDTVQKRAVARALDSLVRSRGDRFLFV